jgi:hypothetical protein
VFWVRALNIVPHKYNGACTTSLSSYPIYTYRRKRLRANCLRALLCQGYSTRRASEPDQDSEADGGRGWRDGWSLISGAGTVLPARERLRVQSQSRYRDSSVLLPRLLQPPRWRYAQTDNPGCQRRLRINRRKPRWCGWPRR